VFDVVAGAIEFIASFSSVVLTEEVPKLVLF